MTVALHALFGLDEELDGVGDEVVIDVDGPPDSTLHARLTGGWAADPYPATAACGLNALPGLRSLPPGLYNAAHVPFAVRRDGDFRGVAR